MTQSPGACLVQLHLQCKAASHLQSRSSAHVVQLPDDELLSDELSDAVGLDEAPADDVSSSS
jgi:hypothetical protein